MLAGGGRHVARAAAADLGGNCCADLEERVAELEATTARKGNRKVSLTISGQVHTAVMAWDDGDDSDVYIVDIANVGGTLFNLNGSAKISPSLTAGFHIQVGLDGAPAAIRSTRPTMTAAAAGDSHAGPDAGQLVPRPQEPRPPHGRPHQHRHRPASPASTSAASAWSPTSTSATGTAQLHRHRVRGVNWADLLGGGTINGSTLSRANAISYTSPTFGGFSVSAAWGEDDIWDVALRYAGEFSGFRVAAGIGYGEQYQRLGRGHQRRQHRALVVRAEPW